MIKANQKGLMIVFVSDTQYLIICLCLCVRCNFIRMEIKSEKRTMARSCMRTWSVAMVVVAANGDDSEMIVTYNL